MQKRFSLPLIFTLFIFQNIFSQTNTFILFPNDLQFMPLKGNHQEARIGVLYYPKNAHLKVDIGNNIDLLKYIVNDELDVNMGIQFMAYAYSTNYQGKRLQIDAIDGFFGGHFSTEYKYSEMNSLKARLRIIHNSAHFVDGHYDDINKKWKDDLEPIPFTQDFGELTVAHVINTQSFGVQYYGSIAYSTLVRPSLIKKYFFNIGFELHSDKIFGTVLDRKVNMFIANHTRYNGMPDYKLSTNNMLGVKFGGWSEKGIVLYLSYHYGNDLFSMYYYKRDDIFGIGFFVDFL
jgi:hypothetical protein